MPLPLVWISSSLGQGPAPVAGDAKAEAPAEVKKADAPAEVKAAPPAAGKTSAKVGVANPPAPPGASDSILPTIIQLSPLVLIFYLLVFRPQQQQEKKRKALINSLGKGQKVLTTAGIYGTVVSAEPGSDKIVVRVDDDKGVKFTFSKASIARVIEPTTEKEKTAEGS